MRRVVVFIFVGVFLSASLMATGQRDAEEFRYPTRAIEIIAGDPGGDSDLFPRITAKYLERHWGMPVVVFNQTSAVSAMRIHSATPDGYLVSSMQDAMMINMVNGVLDFTLDDLTIVAKYAETPSQVVTVRTDSGWNTLNDFVRASQARPDTYTLGVALDSNTGVMGHMLLEAGLNVRLVDSSGALRVQMLEGGHLDASLSPWQRIEDYVVAGRWNALAILEPERSEFSPQVPTAREQGFDVVYSIHHVFYMPRGVDPRIVEEWNRALIAINNIPEYGQEMKDVVRGYARYANATETRRILDGFFPMLRRWLE